MLAGKNNDYHGPKTHRAILRWIQADMKSRGYRMSIYRIERMVLYFFGPYGIAGNFKKKVNFTISYLGRFESSNKLKHEARVRSHEVKLINRRTTARYEAKKRAREAEGQ